MFRFQARSLLATGSFPIVPTFTRITSLLSSDSLTLWRPLNPNFKLVFYDSQIVVYFLAPCTHGAVHVFVLACFCKFPGELTSPNRFVCVYLFL